MKTCATKRAGIALGSNLGDRRENLRVARERICALDGMTPPILQSAIYETSPVDCEAGAQNFLNAVIEIGFEKSVRELFDSLRHIECALGREPSHARNVSRTIDLDLLYFGDAVLGTAELQVPHPRLAQREFVLRPLAEIAPELRLPEQNATVAELLAAVPKTGEVRRASRPW